MAFDSYGRPAWVRDAGGYLSYASYDTATGAVAKAVRDVDTAQAGTYTGLPSGWATPSGGGLHLTTTYGVDALGRAAKVTDPAGHVAYTVYNDPAREVRTYRGWDTSTNTPTGPTEVYRDDRANGYTETLTMAATPAVVSGRPTGMESVGSVQSLRRAYRNAAGQPTHTDAYFDLAGLTYTTSTSLGTLNTHFYRTQQGYTHGGWANWSVSAAGTISRTEYDGLGRPVGAWVGTDDTPATGFWSVTNLAGTDMVKVRAYEYDGGGVGDGNLTKVTESPGLGAADRVTQTSYDWRNRLVAVKAGVEGTESASVNRPITYAEYDNLGRVVATEVYDGDGVTVTFLGGVPERLNSSLLRAKSAAEYDELGRVYRSKM